MDCILLHGWGLTNEALKCFGKSFHGFSNVRVPCLYEIAGKSEDYSFASMAKALNESIKSDTVIIAWSMGGLIATPLAKLSNNIKAIIYIASAPCFVNKEGWRSVIDLKNINDLHINLSEDTNETLVYFSGLITHGDPSTKTSKKRIRSCLANDKSKEILSSWLMLMKNEDQREMFSVLNLPILALFGQNDSLINPGMAKQLKLLNPESESHVIKGCGHAPFISKKNESASAIIEFLNEKRI